jgi:membrane-bound lytic murein transglycosylase D
LKSSKTYNIEGNMSISKTCFSLISALLLLLPILLLSACASRQDPLSARTDQAEASAPAALQGVPATSAVDPLFDLPVTEELTLPEPEITMAQEVEKLDALGSWEEGMSEPEAVGFRFDFPVTINKQVEFYLDFFQNEQRISFSRWLARSGRYLPLIEEHLREAGLPLDLVFLPMIESGYSLTAYSRASAMGPWQFMSGTARHYGLVIDNYVDERRDPVKSTEAAVKYLSRLYEEFGNWHLAVAGYNAGEGRIRGAMRKAETDNFWLLSRFLPTETKLYVPKLIAAIMIAREPDKYGFGEIVPETPLAFETIEVPGLTALRAVAVASGTDLEELQELNRQLRQAVTPPLQTGYTLRVPAGKADLATRNLPRIWPVLTTTYKTHVVGRQENMIQIASKYNLSRTTILQANSLRSATLAPGQRLRIPVQTTTYELLSEEMVSSMNGAPVSSRHLVLHTIKPGETVSGIAGRYSIPVPLVVAWNDLRDINRIRAGQQLALYLASEEDQEEVAVVLAPKTFKLAAVDGKRNDLLRVASISPDSRVPGEPSRHSYYQVQSGDTLWEISRRFKVSTEQIKRWNHLQDDLIHPGLRLLLKVEEDIEV